MTEQMEIAAADPPRDHGHTGPGQPRKPGLGELHERCRKRVVGEIELDGAHAGSVCHLMAAGLAAPSMPPGL